MCGTVIVCGTGGSTIAVCEKSATGTGSPMGMYPSTLAAGGSTNNPSAVFSMTFTKATGKLPSCTWPSDLGNTTKQEVSTPSSLISPVAPLPVRPFTARKAVAPCTLPGRRCMRALAVFQFPLMGHPAAMTARAAAVCRAATSSSSSSLSALPWCVHFSW